MTFWTDRLHLTAARAPDLRPLLAWLAAALLLAAPLAFQGPAAQPSAEVLSARIDDGRGGWQPADLGALVLPPNRVSTLRVAMRVDAASVRAGQPLGLYLSGTFSAEAAWNGAPIGAKGRPASSRKAERAGDVDAVLPIPAALVRPGDNELTLRLSANHLNHGVKTVIHGRGELFGLRVAPFSAEARRPVGYYAAPFLLSGVLVLAFVTLALRGQAASAGGVILGGLLAAALAEVSRAVVNYPYSLHDLRMAPLALAASLTAAAIVLHAGRAAGLARARRRWLSLSLLLVMTLTAGLWLAEPQLLGLAAAAGAVIATLGAHRRRPGALELAAALGLMAALALFDPGDFMDRSLYAAAAPLVAQIVWPRQQPALAPTAPLPMDRLAVGPADARRFVALADIRAIQGAADYAELRLATGERLLHLETLQALAARLPERFFRVHRSHIVNLDAVTALKSAGGGRHAVRLSDGAEIPVSRTQVAELRRRLGA